MEIQQSLTNNFSEIDFNAEFREALRIMENSRENLFITGRAGTGKSTLLSYFTSVTKKNVIILAPTGVAALNVKGQTIHSFFHFKPGITPDTVKTLPRIYSSKYKKIDTIIIDEISMVRADLLDCIDKFMKLNGLEYTLPFGGVQMIFIGDLYQLPPVVIEEEKRMFKDFYKSPYFFDSKIFSKMKVKFIELNKHYRQKDKEFINLLNSIRNNIITDEDLEKLNSRADLKSNQNSDDNYITLTTTNALADSINKIHLDALAGDVITSKAIVSGDFNKKLEPADDNLTLKINSQVMMLNNDQSKRWVNGSIGKVIGVGKNADQEKTIIVEFPDGYKANVSKHTWEIFKFSYENSNKKFSSKKTGSFKQYPMMLAWAVTIHKSQGKTFDRVIIDVGSGTFAYGQLYVALSRCTTLDGIILKRKIERRHILTDPNIAQFLKQMHSHLTNSNAY
jgi:ATP-dependent exoDNAse (exonuclease V) alpha subunit